MKPKHNDWLFYSGLTALAVIEIVEWPVAVIVAVGHYLLRHGKTETEREIGETLEELA